MLLICVVDVQQIYVEIPCENNIPTRQVEMRYYWAWFFYKICSIFYAVFVKCWSVYVSKHNFFIEFKIFNKNKFAFPNWVISFCVYFNEKKINVNRLLSFHIWHMSFPLIYILITDNLKRWKMCISFQPSFRKTNSMKENIFICYLQ